MNTRKTRSGQGSMEFMVAISFVLIMFIVVAVIVAQKEVETREFKVFLDAKRVANSLADNINTIAQQGSGYYKRFHLPDRLYGYEAYDVATAEGVVEITWGNSNWAVNLVTANTTLNNLTKGGMNCVENIGGEVVVSPTCQYQYQS